jgi:hypothetical protein
MSRPLYASDGYPQCKERRLRRIQKQASPVLWQAFQMKRPPVGAIISYDDFLNGKNVEIITWDQLSEKIAEGIV